VVTAGEGFTAGGTDRDPLGQVPVDRRGHGFSASDSGERRPS
jgi:hypothetical protein